MPQDSMTTSEECEDVIYSNNYGDFIVNHFNNPASIVSRYQPVCYHIVDIKQAVIYVGPIEEEQLSLLGYNYENFPRMFGLLDTSAIEAVGVDRVRRQPALDLQGSGVILGFVDTGIDYTHPAFVKADNTSRILSIWDQTVPGGTKPLDFDYGVEYVKEQIDEALSSSNPLEIVPTRDEIGHGTFLAGVAAGNDITKADFSGVAPLADIMVVKLKPAKEIYRRLNKIAEGAICYQENDILLALSYLVRKSLELLQPIVICLGIGTNAGDHNGSGQLENYLDSIAGIPGLIVMAGTGNETNLAHHFKGGIIERNVFEEVELQVGKNERGFLLELWGKSPSAYSVSFLSPSGENIEKIILRSGELRYINFLLEKSAVGVYYSLIERVTGDQVILIIFNEPIEGLWKIGVYNDSEIANDYDMWLPMDGFIQKDTVFIKPDPNITICEPANALNLITSAGYNHINDSIYINSSRGYTRNGRVKPDIAAPAVNVYGPLPGGGYGTLTGTSVATAISAGIAALLVEWAPEGVNMNGTTVKKYMIKGAKRLEGRVYPNREWGYGIVDIYETLLSLRTTQ